jgi:hypothetical protein
MNFPSPYLSSPMSPISGPGLISLTVQRTLTGQVVPAPSLIENYVDAVIDKTASVGSAQGRVRDCLAPERYSESVSEARSRTWNMLLSNHYLARKRRTLHCAE